MFLEKQDTIINEEGKIVEQNITTIRKCSAEQFCQIYLSDYEEFCTLSKAESNVLSVCWKYSSYYEDLNLPGNKITFDKQLKDIISEKTKLAESTIKNAFSSLVKKEMLLKDEHYKGIYYLNPKFFFKGKIADRAKIVHKIEYVIEGNANF